MPDIDQDTTVPLVGPNQGLSLRNWKYLVQGLLQAWPGHKQTQHSS